MGGVLMGWLRKLRNLFHRTSLSNHNIMGFTESLSSIHVKSVLL